MLALPEKHALELKYALRRDGRTPSFLENCTGELHLDK
jgi:hypothetical protein